MFEFIITILISVTATLIITTAFYKRRLSNMTRLHNDEIHAERNATFISTWNAAIAFVIEMDDEHLNVVRQNYKNV